MDSFESISAYAAHGAIVHYAATPETNATLKPEGLYLLDSGAQYLDGTTDITRTIALGEPTEQMRKDFTRVLKGTISLAKSKLGMASGIASTCTKDRRASAWKRTRPRSNRAW